LESIKLTARARTGSGKSYTRKARSAGWVPAAYYGFGIDAVNIEVDAYEFGQILSKHKQNMLIELNGEGVPADATAVIREVQRDAIRRDNVYHVDFQHADEKRPVKTRAFLKLVGTSEGEQLGGILTQTAHEIEIMGPINSIPEVLEADISALTGAGTALMASAIKLDDDITLLTSENRVVARILGKAK
jgi:large subunit ribosomal protein L25